MEEGSKARVDNFVQIIYGRESEVRLLLLAIWCGRDFCDHQWKISGSGGNGKFGVFRDVVKNEVFF